MRTENNRIKHNMRRKARRHFLDTLYAQQNSLCKWCKSACVIQSNIPEDDRISLLQGFVTWQDGDDVFRAKLATVDHLVPLAKGGLNIIDNMVMACSNCNKDRTKQIQIERICLDCGTVLPKVVKSKLCRQCRIQGSIRWLKELGWTETQGIHSSENCHTKFIDPATGVAHILRHACEIAKMRPPCPPLHSVAGAITIEAESTE